MSSLKLRFFFACATLVLAPLSVTPSAAQTATPSQAAISLDQLYSGFIGDWVGQLEYRDFSNDSRVFLPTWLRIARTLDSHSLQFAYTYDDGPTKTVKELSLVSIDATTATATFTSDRDHSIDTYKVAGLSDFAAKGRGTLILTGVGTENEKKVDVRITITLRRNLYTYQKETRPPRQEFQFRDGYTFTRKQAPE